jgi:hypothetical protein
MELCESNFSTTLIDGFVLFSLSPLGRHERIVLSFDVSLSAVYTYCFIVGG